MAETRTELNRREADYGDDVDAATTPDTYRAAHRPTEDAQRLEREIAHTRREMAGTIESIQQRLDPQRLKYEAERRIEEAVERTTDKVEDATIGRVNRMTERAKYKATNWRHDMVNTIKDNPVPAALVGVGLGWLIMEGTGRDDYDEYTYDDEDYGYGDYRYGDYRYSGDRPYQGRYRGTVEREQAFDEGLRRSEERDVGQRARATGDEIRHRVRSARNEASERIDETTDELRHRARSARENAGEQWDELRDETRHRARYLRSRARTQGQHARRNVQELMRETPLAVGAAAMALGVLVGWAMPATETENRLVGEYRDDLVDQARHEARTVAKTAQTAAKDALEDVKEETKTAAKQAAGEVSEESKRAAERVSENR